MTTPALLSKEKFNTYAGMGDGEFPEGHVNTTSLQAHLRRWQQENFPKNNRDNMFFGIVEEVGELGEALGHYEYSAGTPAVSAVYVGDIGDALADIGVFLFQLLTTHELDAGAALEGWVALEAGSASEDMSPLVESTNRFLFHSGSGAYADPVDLSRIQVQLCRIGTRKGHEFYFRELVVAVGQLAHVILKNAQGIRGLGDETTFKSRITQHSASMLMAIMQIATCFRLDYGVLFEETATTVMQRNWKANPTDAHKQ